MGTPEKKRPMYLLSYDHGGYVLWGEHLEAQLASAYDWLAKYPGFKIGLDNECFAYDIYSEIAPHIMDGIKEALKKYKGRFAKVCRYTPAMRIARVLKKIKPLKALFA